MKVTVRPEVKILYPRVVFGSLKIYNQKNTRGWKTGKEH